MKAMRLWQGVRMRQVAARPDPDGPARLVTLPASWDDRAADALAALLPGDGPVSLAAGAAVWIGMVAARARQAGQDTSLAMALRGLLHRRQAAPDGAVWRCEAGVPGFRLNVAGFHGAATGYDVAGFAQAATWVARACRLLAPAAPRYEIGLSGLDDLLACLGLDYDGRAARAVAACLAALLRASVEQALEGEQRDLLAAGPDWPAPPAACALPGLAEAALAAHAAVRRAPGGVPATGVFAPGPADALLGIETGGIAPAFSPVRDRHLTRAAQDRLAAAALSPEAALAATLVGETPLPRADHQAHAAMQQAVAPYLEAMPALPAGLPAPERASAVAGAPRHRKLPARHGGLTQKVTIGGHRVFLRTAEYPDGRLGEISLNLPRETAPVRALAECFAQAVSLGLQHGVPLDEFVEAFALTRFGPAGAVEGDPDVDRATSVLDYVFRTLSATYLGRVLPEAPAGEALVPEDGPRAAGAAPLLPLDLPRGRRGGLRLVA
jgi:hypothetical protein